MKLLFIADGRSPIAINWIRYFTERDFDVHLVSLFPCAPDLRLASLIVIPVAFSGLIRLPGDHVKVKGGPQAEISQGSGGINTNFRKAATPRFRTALRQWFVPLSLPRGAILLKKIISATQPDLIHALRIPYEGMLAALTEPDQPLLLSVWGNDFTLHAPSTWLMRRYTRLALARCTALHTDCQHDLNLAHQWGYPASRPAIVLPGAGGVQLDLFYPAEREEPAGINGQKEPVVINPRGFRAYVRNDTFFRAIPTVLASQSGVHFLCPAMAGEVEAARWVEKLGVSSAVELLPRIPREQMASLLRRSQVVVSVTTHDGTPNSLLEAMACGCFPVAGDLESLREWITPGVNGFLVDPGDPQALAEAILSALEQPALRQKALRTNTRLVAERADYRQVMAKAEGFYRLLTEN